MGFSHRDIHTDGLSDRQLGQLLGNSMSVNVLERILSRALCAAGLADWSNLCPAWERMETAAMRVRELSAERV